MSKGRLLLCTAHHHHLATLFSNSSTCGNLEFRNIYLNKDAAWTAQTTLEFVKSRSTVPDRHQPAPLVLLTAKGRYSDEPQSGVFSRSKVSLAGIVRVAKYFRIFEWTTISRSSVVLETALKWIKQADLHADDYWHHYYKILRRKSDPFAKKFLLGMSATYHSLPSWFSFPS
jgi:hypothetical protein